MAKNYKLIPGENNNWEVAVFLLIDHLYVTSSQISRIEFTRTDMHSSINALGFIENLLGPLNYVVDKTLSNSISSAITRLEKKGYLECEDGHCILTKHGFLRLKEIKDKYTEGDIEPIGINKTIAEETKKSREAAKKAIKESKDLTEEQKKAILKNLWK